MKKKETKIWRIRWAKRTISCLVAFALTIGGINAQALSAFALTDLDMQESAIATASADTECTVTLVTNTDSGRINYSIVKGSVFNKPDTLVKQGYVFSGWYTNESFSGLPYDFSTPVEQDIFLYAKWDINTYAISYKGINVTDVNINPSSYTVEESVTLKDPQRVGYTFIGWTTDGVTTPTKGLQIRRGSRGFKTFTANWEVSKVTVNFDSKGGSKVSSESVAYGSTVGRPNDPTRALFTFKGWYDNSNCSGNEFDFTTPIKENTTLWAKWEASVYKIDYKGIKNSDVNDNPKSYSIESGTLTLKNPTRAFNLFLGWTTEGVTTPTRDLKVEVGSTGDKTFTANWAYKTINVYNQNNCLFNSLKTYNKSGKPGVLSEVVGTTESDWKLTLIDSTKTLTVGYGARSGDLISVPYSFTGSDITQISVVVTTDEISADDSEVIYYGRLDNVNLLTKTGVATFTLPSSLPTGSQIYFIAESIADADSPDAASNPVKLVMATEHTVTFDKRNDESYFSKSVREGEALSKPADPTKVGYTFAGWYDNEAVSGQEYDFSSVVEKNFTLYAKWEPITYSIVYSGLSDGDTNNNLTSYTIETETFRLKDPIKVGYTFKGWTTDTVTVPEKALTIDKGSIGNKSFRANWEVTKCTVKFSNNGNLLDSKVVQYGQTVSEVTVAPRIGYNFDGWYLSKDFEGVAFNFSSPITSDLTLYAKWEATKYAVTYDGLRDGDLNNNPSYYTMDSGLIVLMDPIRTGGIFKGWTTDGVTTPTRFLRIEQGSYGDKRFTANWENKSIMISSGWQTQVNGELFSSEIGQSKGAIAGTLLKIDGKVDNGRKSTLRDDTKTVTLGKAEKEDNVLSFSYAFTGNDVTQLSLVVTSGDIKSSYSEVLYYGALKDVDLSLKTGTCSFTLPEGLPSGYEMYVVAEDVNGSTQTDYASVPVRLEMTTEYSVTFDYRTSQLSTTTKVREGENAVKPANPTRTGYNFAGWYENEYGVGSAFDFSVPPTKSMTLYAKWTPISYTITYEGTEDNTDGNPTTYTIETSTITLKDPVKVGYTFLGWTTSEVTEPAKGFQIAQGSIGNKVYKANWEVNANELEVKFDTQGAEAIDPVGVIFNTMIEQPEDPELPGYEFRGWYDNRACSGNSFDFSSAITRSFTLYAKWEETTYSITYTGLYSQDVNNNPTTYNVDSTITLQDPKRQGGTFLGWTMDGDSTPTKNLTIPAGSYGDKTIKANWQTLPISLGANGIDDNGGKWDPDKGSYVRFGYSERASSDLSMKYRVLKNNGGKLLLDYDGVVGDTYLTNTGKVSEYEQKAYNNCARYYFGTTVVGKSLKNATLQMNTDSEVISLANALEKKFISPTSLSSGVYNRNKEYSAVLRSVWLEDPSTSGEFYSFLLSAKEVLEYYPTKSSRYKGDYWWTRTNSISSGSVGWDFKFCYLNYWGEYPAYDSDYGTPTHWQQGELLEAFPTFRAQGISPAMWIKNPLFFTKCGQSKGYEDGKLISQETSDSGSSSEDNNDYELTYVDDQAKFVIGDVNISNNTISFPYTYTNGLSEASRISIVVLGGDTGGELSDPSSQILYYGKASGFDPVTKTGTASFQLPSSLPEQFKIYAMVEDCNAKYETDFVSEPAEIKLDFDVNTSVENGSITESGVAQQYSNRTIYYAPNDGYELSKVIVDGEELQDLNDNRISYTFSNIRSSHSIKVINTPILYHMLYDLNGGKEVEDNVRDFTVSTDSFLLKAPTKKNLSFAGWTSDDITTPTKDYMVKKGTIGDVSVKANWEAKVVFDTKSGSPVDSKSVAEGSQVTAPDCTKDGFELEGWYTDSSLTHKFNFETPVTQNMTLYAKWVAKVNFDSKGGTEVGEKFVQEGKAVESPDDPTKENLHFGGWYMDEACTIPYNFDRKVLESMTLYAKWNAQVDFQTNNEQTLDSILVKEGDVVGKQIEMVSFEGYEFKGWYDNEVFYGEAFDAETQPVSGDMTLYAKWGPITYTITYLGIEAGRDINENPTEYNIETKTFVLTYPTKVGYVFSGWTNDEITVPTKGVQIAKGTTGNKVYTANWVPDVHTVRFDSVGGSNVGDQDVEYGKTLDVPSVPFKNGYKFKGWYETSTYDGEEFNFETSVTRDFTLYAKWEAEVYTITYLGLKTGDVNTNPQTYTVETNTFKLVDPVRVGSTFSGWTTEDVKTPVKGLQIKKGSFGNKTFTANWGANTCTVQFDSRGGTDVDPVGVTYNTRLTLPKEPTRIGYVFKGWYDNPECAGDVYDTSLAVVDDFTLYAKWQVVNYSIEYEGLEVGDVNNNPITYNVETATFRLNDPVRDSEDWVFIGWSTEENPTPVKGLQIAQGSAGNKKFIANWAASQKCNVLFETKGGTFVEPKEVKLGEPVARPENPTYGDLKFAGWFTDEACTNEYNFEEAVLKDTLVLYAKWNCIVTFNSNGGTEVESQEVKLGDRIVKPKDDPKNDSMIFGGWFTDEACKSAYAFETPVTGNFTLYAKWTVDKFVVTFNPMNSLSITTTEVVNGGTVTKPEDPTKTGYDFKGWYSNENCIGEPYNFGSSVTQNIILYAKWEIKTFTVKFDSMGGSEVEGKTVNYNATVEKPDDPSNGDLVFAGWYLDFDPYVIKYEFKEPVTEDLTLYAKWVEAEKLNIVFDSDGGTPAVLTIPVPKGGTLKDADQELPVPTKTGYTLVGWYIEGTNIQVTTDTVFSEAASVVASWKLDTFTVKFNSNGGTAVSNKTVTNGSKVSKPSNPTRTGYTFGGWYSDSTLKNAFNFNTAITQNLTLYAKWTLQRVNVYRLVNNFTGEHFYTTDAKETAALKAQKKNWTYEGVGWVAPGISKTSVHRFSNKYTGEHFFSVDTAEIAALKKDKGYSYEGIAWYASDTKTNKPINRFLNKVTGEHFFTADSSEIAALKKNKNFANEGVAWYGLS